MTTMSEEVSEYVTAAIKECVTAAVCTAMKTGIVKEYVTAAVKEYVTAAVNECVAAAVYAGYAAMRERKKLTPRSRATNENYPHRPKRRRYRQFNGISDRKHARDESSGQVAGPKNTQDEDSPHRPVKRFKSSDEEYDDDVFDGISNGDLLSICPLAESPTSTPGNSVKAVSFSDMPLDIILQIANRTDMETLNSLSRTCKGFSVFLRWHRRKDTQLLRAVERGDLPDIETIFQSPSATARGGLGLLAKVVKDHKNYIDLVNEEHLPFFSMREALIELLRERLSRTVALVRVLLEAGAEIDGCDKRGFTALHWATRCYDIANTGLDLVRLLLDFGADVNSLGTVGLTPLHAASCPYPMREIINSLIEAGANVNSKDKYGLTPLHVAALNMRGTVVFRVLENAGAVINIDGSRGYQLAPICSEGCFYHYHDSSCQVPLDDRVDLQREYGVPGNIWLPDYSEFCHVTVYGER